ncbi:MAG: type VI secretion system tube protein Hcp [bacterium]|nr:type VI secretion system tube protein Hcp [bacterium]
MNRHRFRPQLAGFALALLVVPCAAHASGRLYLYAENGTWGHIEGESTAQGHEDWIECLSFQHSVSIPIGPGGAAAGAPQTTPLVISSLSDRSTVRLLSALAAIEPFSALRLEWVDDVTGDVLLRLELFDALLASTSQTGGSGDSRPFVSLSFAYRAVEITDLLEGTTAFFDWNPFSSSTPETLAKGLLLSPSPNPTQGPAEFRFSLPADSNAVLALYDLRGHRVRELHSGWTPAGGGSVAWDGTDEQGRRVGQGVYLARLTSPDREVTQRLTVLR